MMTMINDDTDDDDNTHAYSSDIFSMFNDDAIPKISTRVQLARVC